MPKDRANHRCLDCQIDMSSYNANRKRCNACRELREINPPHNLDEFHQAEALKLAGKISRTAIADKLGVSRASIQRFARERSDVYWGFEKYK